MQFGDSGLPLRVSTAGVWFEALVSALIVTGFEILSRSCVMGFRGVAGFGV